MGYGLIFCISFIVNVFLYMKLKELQMINNRIQGDELEPLLERIKQLEQHNEYMQ